MFGTVAANLAGLAQITSRDNRENRLSRQAASRPRKNSAPDGNCRMPDIVAAIRAPENLGIDDAGGDICKTDRDKLAARSLNSLIEGPAAQLFRDGLPLNIDRMRRPALAGKTRSNVVYFNAMGDDAQKQFFVASLAAEIYRWMVARFRRRPNANPVLHR